MQCDSGPSFPASPLIQDDGLLRRDFARRGFPSALAGLHEQRFCEKHSRKNVQNAGVFS
jgi:hypothetical protein